MASRSFTVSVGARRRRCVGVGCALLDPALKEEGPGLDGADGRGGGAAEGRALVWVRCCGGLEMRLRGDPELWVLGTGLVSLGFPGHGWESSLGWGRGRRRGAQWRG